MATASTGGTAANAPSGTFHRLESPTQTAADAVVQVASGEVWGAAARGSSIPSVKAYRNQIPTGARGIEFTSNIAPAVGSGSPFEARWYYPHTPGVLYRNKNGFDYAAINAAIRNLQP